MVIPTLRTEPITDENALPDQKRKGRGSVSNRLSGRFDAPDRYATDDGWEPDERPKLRTILSEDTARKIISFNDSPDIGFDRSINPYKGCEHGCIYCFARPTHAYLDLSPGIDFETRIFRKPDAPQLLRKELSHPRYKPAPLMLGINTDAYQPTERTEGLTRRLLEVLYEFRHPVHLITKSALIQRDIDILGPMAAEQLVTATLSITTLDRHLARIMEPRAATPHKRFETIAALSAAGIPTGMMIGPVIPGLTCHEIEALVKAAAEAGAVRAGYNLIRLPHEVKILFDEWLTHNFPDRRNKVLNMIRQCRDGKLNDANFGSRMSGEGVYAELIHQRFHLAVKKHGLGRLSRDLNIDAFRGGDRQMSLF
ncbi:MAG: PA0069 family radical SAM protein [Asticcacaulis sp.]